MLKSRTCIAVPPGATISEQLADRGITQEEFALRMNLSEERVTALLCGEEGLTSDVAVRLETVLGVPAQFWINLEGIYRDKLVVVKLENAMDAERELVGRFPYKELAKLQWVPEARDIKTRVRHLCRFFEVTQLDRVLDVGMAELACRRLSVTEKGDFALAAWAQKARLEARNHKVGPVDLQALRGNLPQLRAMTVQSPEEFAHELVDILAQTGVVLVLLPHIGGSFLHGVTFTEGSKYVVGLTVRGKDADKFWFSLFHELGHILLGHVGRSEGTTEGDEEDADTFARDTLLPPDEYRDFVQTGDFSKQSVVRFSRFVGLTPGIVVGRLQKEKLIPYSYFNDLKIRYSLS